MQETGQNDVGSFITATSMTNVTAGDPFQGNIDGIMGQYNAFKSATIESTSGDIKPCRFNMKIFADAPRWSIEIEEGDAGLTHGEVRLYAITEDPPLSAIFLGVLGSYVNGAIYPISQLINEHPDSGSFIGLMVTQSYGGFEVAYYLNKLIHDDPAGSLIKNDYPNEVVGSISNFVPYYYLFSDLSALAQKRFILWVGWSN